MNKDRRKKIIEREFAKDTLKRLKEIQKIIKDFQKHTPTDEMTFCESSELIIQELIKKGYKYSLPLRIK